MEKKKFAFPHSYVIIMTLIILAAALTWVIPSGEFDRVPIPGSKKMMVVADSFHYIKSTPVNLFEIPYKIMFGLKKYSDIIFLVLIVGGAFNIIIKTGMFQAFAEKMTKKFASKEIYIIPVFTLIFALSCMSMGVNTFIGFAPVGIIIARSMGYDAIVGVSMVMLGGAIGFSTGTFNPFTTGVAQGIAGLPLFSGLEYRLFCLFCFWIVTNIYIIRYALKVKADPTKSAVYGVDFSHLETGEEVKLYKKHFLVLAVVVVCFAVMVYGGVNMHWKLKEAGAVFIYMGILSGLAFGFGPSKIAKLFIEGAKKLVFGALIVGIAGTISLILKEGHILDTAVLSLSNSLGNLPHSLQAVGMFLMQCFTDGLVTSGSGQAAVTMPIMIPVADMLGITRQTAVLGFNFGDGFTNYILPSSSALMGFLAISNIPYEKWMKYMWKLYLIWLALGSVLIFIANFIKLGPA